MSLQQGSRKLAQLCLQHSRTLSSSSFPRFACSPILLLNQQQASSTACGPAAASCNSRTPVRAYAADAPDPMIVPVQKQTAVQHHQSAGPPERNRGPWERVQDKASGGHYWWNKATGATTPVGVPKPDAWVEVVDQQTGHMYYWNQDSNDTTAVGEPMPGPEGRVAGSAGSQNYQLGQQQQQVQQAGTASVLVNSLAVGFGVGLVFGVIRLFI